MSIILGCYSKVLIAQATHETKHILYFLSTLLYLSVSPEKHMKRNIYYWHMAFNTSVHINIKNIAYSFVVLQRDGHRGLALPISRHPYQFETPAKVKQFSHVVAPLTKYGASFSQYNINVDILYFIIRSFSLTLLRSLPWETIARLTS